MTTQAGLSERAKTLLENTKRLRLFKGATYGEGAAEYLEQLDAFLRAAISALDRLTQPAPDWRPIETAPKDGKAILLKIKNPIPQPRRDDLAQWNGLIFVGRHPGLADDGFDIGWNFAAPVGCGGFPDDWFEGWMPLDALPPPPPATEGE